MYAKSINYISSNEARLNIISDSKPSVFPLNTDNISNLPDGITLATGSIIYLIEQEKSYILGENKDWTVLPESGGGGGLDGRAATTAEVNEVISGLHL